MSNFKVGKNIKLTNFFLLLSTCYPGGARLVTLTLVKLNNENSLVSAFVNDVFIVYIFTFFTSINWSVFILTDKSDNTLVHKGGLLIKILLNSFLSICILTPIVLGLFYFGIIQSFWCFLLYLLSWSFYNLVRVYLINSKLTFEVCIIDTIVLALIVLASFKFKASLEYILCSHSLIYLISFVFVLFRKRGFINDSVAYFINNTFKTSYIRSANYGIINMFSGGIDLMLAPISYQLFSSGMTAFIGFLNNVGSILVLLPRSLSYLYLPEFSKGFHDNDISHLQSVYAIFRQKIKLNMAFSIGCILILLIFAGYLRKFFPQFDLTIANSIIVIVYFLNILVAQMSLPASNIVITFQKERYLFIANMMYFFGFCISSFFIVKIKGSAALLFTLLILSLVGLNFFRGIYLDRVKKTLFSGIR